MSLYYLQKLLYRLNRDPKTRERFDSDREALLNEYELTDEEREAILKPDIGLLFVLGVNALVYGIWLWRKWLKREATS